jgi:NAD(P)-dependent dehydrogenase (short-subunit alcohol dehydrogenase family)
MKSAWVTGGGSGIGRAVSLELARRGFRVAISGRDLDKLAQVASDPAGAGQISAFPCDVTDPASIAQALAAIRLQFGEIDKAILNAGTHLPMSAEDFNTATARRLMEVNYFGVVQCLEALLPGMLASRRGQLAIVASLAGYRGLPTAAAYGPSKAALMNLCESLKPDLDRRGVKIQLISPGFVATPLTDLNDFTMPDLIAADDAARTIVDGLEKPAFEIAFPWRFSRIMNVMRCLPYGLFFRLTARLSRAAQQ